MNSGWENTYAYKCKDHLNEGKQNYESASYDKTNRLDMYFYPIVWIYVWGYLLSVANRNAAITISTIANAYFNGISCFTNIDPVYFL